MDNDEVLDWDDTPVGEELANQENGDDAISLGDEQDTGADRMLEVQEEDQYLPAPPNGSVGEGDNAPAHFDRATRTPSPRSYPLPLSSPTSPSAISARHAPPVTLTHALPPKPVGASTDLNSSSGYTTGSTGMSRRQSFRSQRRSKSPPNRRRSSPDRASIRGGRNQRVKDDSHKANPTRNDRAPIRGNQDQRRGRPNNEDLATRDSGPPQARTGGNIRKSARNVDTYIPDSDRDRDIDRARAHPRDRGQRRPSYENRDAPDEEDFRSQQRFQGDSSGRPDYPATNSHPGGHSYSTLLPPHHPSASPLRSIFVLSTVLSVIPWLLRSAPPPSRFCNTSSACFWSVFYSRFSSGLLIQGVHHPPGYVLYLRGADRACCLA